MIPRNSPEAVTHINDEEIVLDWYNSTLYRFEAYPEMDHIFIKIGGTVCSYIFDSPEEMKILEDLKFPIHRAVEPDERDIEYYMTWQIQNLQEEIAEL